MTKKAVAVDLSVELQAARERIVALEQELEASRRLNLLLNPEQKLNKLLEILPVGVSVLNAERQVVFENLALERILGIDRAGLESGAYKNRRYLASDGSPMPPEGFASMQAARSGQAAYNVETGVVKGDGETIWTNVSAVPVDFPDWRTVIVTADVTERKRAQEELQNQRRDLNALIENTDGSIWAVDSEYRLIVGNELYHQNTSAVLKRRFATGECVLTTEFPPAALDEWRGYYDRALAGERFSMEVQTRFATPVSFVEYRFNPIISETGNVIGVTIFGRDITERKQSEAALRASETQYRGLFEHMMEGYAYCQMLYEGGTAQDWIYLLVNDAFEQQTGLKGVNGKRVSEVIPNIRDADPGLFEIYSRVALTGQPEKFETFVESLQMWFSVSVYSPRKEFFVTVFDVITERKLAEQALRESEERFHLMFEKHSAVMLLIEPESGNILDANASAQAYYGYTLEQLKRMEIQQINAMPPEQVAEQRRKAVDEGKAFFEFPHRLASGEIRDVEVHSSPISQGGTRILFSIIHDVTARKQAESQREAALEKLRESEELLRMAFDAANLGVWKNDLRTGSVEFDERARIHYGFDTTQTTLAEVTNRVHPDDVARLGSEIAAATGPTGDGNLVTEYRVIHPDGSTHWLAIGVQVTFEGEGEQRHSVMGFGTSMDITARRQAEEALRRSEEKYSALFEKSAVPSALTKMPEGTFADVNEAFQSVYGYSRAEVLGKTSLEIGMAQPAERSQSVFDLEKYGALQDNEKHLFTKSGDTRVGLVNINKAVIAGRNYVITTIHDITERKLAEIALAESRENFIRTFDLNPAAMVLTRKDDGKFMRFNAAYTHMIGYQPEELIGRTAGDMKMYANPEQRQEVLGRLAVEGNLRDYEVSVRIKSGEIRTLVLYMEPLRFEDEDCLLSALMDITERRKMEEDLRRSNAELEQFAYVASHDLQEPLRTVAGMVELLKERYGGKLDERADTYINHAVDASLRMQKLINDLLEFSRVNRFGKAFELVSMETVLETAIKNLKAAIDESQAAITHDPLPMVSIDPAQIAQVLQNLLGNAIKFRSERPLEIHFGAQKMDGNWQFSLRDNGIGIEPRHFERIFVIFQRLHTRRDYPGTGIGLSLCKKIIERHGGKIWLESVPNQGTTFLFTIPEKQHE